VALGRVGIPASVDTISFPISQVLPPEIPLEDAILECCRGHTDTVLVAVNKTQELVGLATIRELNVALENWYHKQDKSEWRDRTALHDQLQKAMIELTTHGTTSDAMEIFTNVVRKMKRPTGLTLGQVCDRDFDTVLGDDKVVRARDLMDVRGASLLPVMRDADSNVACKANGYYYYFYD